MAGINFTTTDAIVTQLNKVDADLLTAIGGLETDASQDKLLKVQKKFQEWTTFVQMVTTVNKELADTLKGILQKV